MSAHSGHALDLMLARGILAAEGKSLRLILRIIFEPPIEHGKNINRAAIWLDPVEDGANASVPRRDLHNVMDGAGDRKRMTMASRKCGDRRGLAA